MKVGDEVRFLDARTKTWHEGTLMALDEAAGTARVDTDDCGGVVDVALEESPLFVTHEARASNTKLLPRWQPKEPAEKPAKESRESKEKPMTKTNKAPSANHTPEHMRALRAANLKEPVACLDCKVAFVRTAPSQKRCPECQGKRLKQMQGDWYLRKKAAKAAGAAGNDGKHGSDGSNGKPAAAAVIPAPVTPVVPAEKTHASAGIGTGGGWLAFAARHRQIADLAEQIAGLMAEGGAA